MSKSTLWLFIGILSLIPVLGIIPVIYYLINRKKITNDSEYNSKSTIYKIGNVLYIIGGIYNAVILLALIYSIRL